MELILFLRNKRKRHLAYATQRTHRYAVCTQARNVPQRTVCKQNATICALYATLRGLRKAENQPLFIAVAVTLVPPDVGYIIIETLFWRCRGGDDDAKPSTHDDDDALATTSVDVNRCVIVVVYKNTRSTRQ